MERGGSDAIATVGIDPTPIAPRRVCVDRVIRGTVYVQSVSTKSRPSRGPLRHVSSWHIVYLIGLDPYYAVAEWPQRSIDVAAATSSSRRANGTGSDLEGGAAVSEQIVQDSGTFRAMPAGRVYMTGDLRALTGLPRTHMDFFLREGIIRPVTRTESGYLLFDDTELETLRAVLRWREEGVAISEIRSRLGRPAPQ